MSATWFASKQDVKKSKYYEFSHFIVSNYTNPDQHIYMNQRRSWIFILGTTISFFVQNIKTTLKFSWNIVRRVWPGFTFLHKTPPQASKSGACNITSVETTEACCLLLSHFSLMLLLTCNVSSFTHILLNSPSISLFLSLSEGNDDHLQSFWHLAIGWHARARVHTHSLLFIKLCNTKQKEKK